MKGAPSVQEECLDFDIRDKLSNWVKFTADQIVVVVTEIRYRQEATYLISLHYYYYFHLLTPFDLELFRRV